MFNGKPLLAIVPARGGSKGIPGKNLRRLGRDTLLERAIKLGKTCAAVDQVVVTTDDPEMYALAEKHAAAAPTLRPAHLAGDSVRTIDVILPLLDQIGFEDGFTILLQPTAPFRTLADMNGVLAAMEGHETEANGVVSVCDQIEHSPYKLQTVKNGFLAPLMAEGDGGAPRQQLPKVYALNGAFYLLSAETLRRARTFLPPRMMPYLMPKERSINLDGMFDWYLAETLVEKNLVPFEEYE